MMKTLCLALLMSLCATATAVAQDIRSFQAALGEPVRIDSLTTVLNTVYVEERGDAGEVIDRGSASMRRNVNGYRVVIFMSNSQSARADALAANDSFALMHPDEKSYITYENPYFKVAVGNCTSQEEAIVLMERVRPNFPKAFLMREIISASELVMTPKSAKTEAKEPVAE